MTSRLWNHLRNDHGFIRQEPPKANLGIDRYLKPKTITEARQAEIDRLLVGMIEKDLQCLNLKDRDGLADLIHYFEPAYCIPHASTLENKLIQSNRDLKGKMKKLTKQALSPSFVMDLWKSKKNV